MKIEGPCGQPGLIGEFLVNELILKTMTTTTTMTMTSMMRQGVPRTFKLMSATLSLGQRSFCLVAKVNAETHSWPTC